MKKLIAIGVLAFALGTALTALVLVNPFRWEWTDRIAHLMMDARISTTADDTAAPRLWTCAMHPEIIRDVPGECPICGMTLVPVDVDQAPAPTATAAGERKIKYWQAPMDPTYLSDKPGKSPMGMDLIPVYEDEAGETPAGLVKIDPTFVQNIGVQSEPVARTDIPFTIRTVGNVTYNDQGVTWINTKYEGWIEKVYVNYVGETVKKGQKLFEIYSPQLVSTQTEYIQALDYAQRMAEGKYPEVIQRARSLLDSSRQRLEFWDITAEQIHALEESRTPTRTLAVVSNVDGMIVEKMDQALEGMYATVGMNLYKVVDLSTVWVEVEIFENQVPWVKLGQQAVVELPYEPGRQYVGRVRYLFPFFDEKTRTMKASIELANPGRKLRADMYANVTIAVPSARGVLAVPEESVIQSGTRNVVVLDRGDGTFQVSEVELGVNGGGLWEVRTGVAEGDRVVVSAQFLIDSESSLKEAIRKVTSRRAGSQAEVPPPAIPEHQP